MNNRFELRTKQLALEGSWIVIGQLTTVVGSLIMVRILTDHLSPTQYGELALTLTFVALINQLVMVGVGNATSRFYSIALQKEDLAAYLNASFSLLIYAGGAVLIIGLMVMVGLWRLDLEEWVELSAGALLLSILAGSNGAINGMQNASRNRSTVAFHGGAETVLRISLVLIIFHYIGTTSTSVIAAYTCSSMIILCSQIFHIKRSISPSRYEISKNHHWLRKMFLFTIPFSTWGGFTWLQLASDRWALQNYATTNDVGQYAVLYQIGYTPIAIATGLVTSFFWPILFRKSGDTTIPESNSNVHRISWKITQIALAITLLGFGATFIFHKFLFSWLVSNQYREISYLLPWIFLAGGVFTSGEMLALKLMSELNSSKMTTAKICTAVIGSILNIIGAKAAGIDGVVTALVTFSLTYLLWMTLLTRDPTSKQKPNNNYQ